MGRTPTGTGSPRVVNLASESGAWEACHTGPSAPHLGRHQGLKRGGSEDVVEISGLGNVDRLPADVGSSRVFNSQAQGMFAQDYLGQRRVVALSPQVEKEEVDCENKTMNRPAAPAEPPSWVSFGMGLEALCFAGRTAQCRLCREWCRVENVSTLEGLKDSKPKLKTRCLQDGGPCGHGLVGLRTCPKGELLMPSGIVSGRGWFWR